MDELFAGTTGRSRTWPRVVDHYDSCFQIGLSSQQKSDLVEFLKAGDRSPKGRKGSGNTALRQDTSEDRP